MKRIISLFIVVVMIASMCVFTTPGASAATLDEHNVGVEIPHFSGWTSWNPPAGYATRPGRTPMPAFGKYDTWLKVADLDVDDDENWELIEEMTADYDGALIRLDGVITPEEWGLPLVTVDSDYAAQKGSNLPSAENTYYYYEDDVDGKLKLNREAGLSFKLWMAWDEGYLYIAAVVDDPDGLFCNYSGENVWNADCLQIRIDPDGPNSVVGGHGYDASQIAYPWASAERVINDTATLANPGAEINGGKVINLGAAYYSPTTASGRTELFDMSPRYYPKRVAVTLENGEVDYYKTEYKQWGAGYKSVAENAPNPFGMVCGAILPLPAPTDENADRYETTYEIAIPWTYLNGSMFEYSYDEETGEETCELKISDWVPGVGDEFGVSIALLNAAYGSSGYNSWLTWGSGVCGGQMGTDDGTAGGSNSMVLSSAELGTVGCDHEFSEPTCTSPYVCSKCDYEKGFCVGHDYTTKVVSTPTSTKDGKVVATCNTCGYVYEAIVKAEKGSVTKTWSEKFGDPEWSSYEHAYVDDNDNPVWNEDGTRKTNYITYEGEKVLAYLDAGPGTYFYTDSKAGTYSYKYDLKLTDLSYDPADLVHESTYHYIDGVYHWFGGIMNTGTNLVHGISYAAGFFPSEKGSTSGKFMIREAVGGVFDNVEQAILCESAEIDLGKDWHEIVFMFDDDSDTAFIFCDGELMCGTWNEGFDMKGVNDSANPIMRRFDTSYVMKGMQLGNKTAFIDNVVVPSNGYTLTCDGEVIGTYDAGEVVELPVPSLYTDSTGSAYRFYTWESADVTVDRSEYSAAAGTANGRTYSVVMPDTDVELTAKYVLVGDVDGNGEINGLDAKLINAVNVGSSAIEGINSEAADVKLNGQINSLDIKELKSLVLGISMVEK